MKKALKLNLVLIVKNEEKNIERCISSARGLVDSVIIADTGSTDRTMELAEKAGAKVYQFTWTGDFSEARNFALDQSDGDWNLVLDADEVLYPADRAKLEAWIRRNGRCLGAILLKDTFLSPDSGEPRSKYGPLPRLLPADIRYKGMIHEQPDTELPVILTPLSAFHDGYLGPETMKKKGIRNLAYLERAVSEYPEDAYYQYQMAVTLKNVQRLKESLPYFQSFYRLSSPQDGYWADGILLWLYTLADEKVGRLQEAGAVMEETESFFKSNPDFYLFRGIWYMKLIMSDTKAYIGLLSEIEKSWKRCLEIGEQPELGGVEGAGSFLALYNLGTWYEVSGQTALAAEAYKRSAAAGYAPAAERLKLLT